MDKLEPFDWCSHRRFHVCWCENREHCDSLDASVIVNLESRPDLEFNRFKSSLKLPECAWTCAFFIALPKAGKRVANTSEFFKRYVHGRGVPYTYIYIYVFVYLYLYIYKYVYIHTSLTRSDTPRQSLPHSISRQVGVSSEVIVLTNHVFLSLRSTMSTKVDRVEQALSDWQLFV